MTWTPTAPASTRNDNVHCSGVGARVMRHEMYATVVYLEFGRFLNVVSDITTKSIIYSSLATAPIPTVPLAQPRNGSR